MYAATWLFTRLSGARMSSRRPRIAVVPRSRVCYQPAVNGNYPLFPA